MNAQQRKDYGIVLTEYNALSSKLKHTKQEEIRMAFLQTAAAAIREGATLQELEQDMDNERRSRAGMEPIKRNSILSREQEIEARGWKQFSETRDMVEGAPMLAHFGTYTGLGYFVPNDFFSGVFAAMKAHDVLFDDDACTVIRSSNGRPLPIPCAGDTENVASVVSESGSQSSVDIDSTGHAVVGAYSYSTPRFVASLESFQDLEGNVSVTNLFKKFSADRLARGIGKDLVTGNGSNKPLGLIPSLLAAGVPTVIASGAAANTGGSETGANSLGSKDFQSAISDLDSAYLSSDKVAWLMTHKTLVSVSGIVNKMGNQLNLVQYVDGKPFIYGVPVKICPSMDEIGATANSVVLGDLNYWATRLVVDDMAGIRQYHEAPGLVENGNFGLRCFARADGALLYKDSGSPSPFVIIQQHS